MTKYGTKLKRIICLVNEIGKKVLGLKGVE
jgi:hypothetical protein